MTNIDFTLSTNNLNNIPFHKYPKDFSFIINGRSFATTRIEADILSPIIRKLHFTDESIKEFHLDVQVPDSNESSMNHYFEEFLNLCTFGNITIDSNRQSYFSEYFIKLGNTDEYFRIHPEFFKSFTTENVLDQLQNILNISETFSEENDHINSYIQQIISFISSHFNDLDKERIRHLPAEILEKILGNKNLQISDEDSLFDFVLSLYKSDNSYSYLFEYVIFSNISEKSLELFINSFSIEDINNRIWNRICSRLLPSKEEQAASESRYTNTKPSKQEFKYVEGNEFHGIFDYLQKKSNGNIESEVNFSASSYRGNDVPLNTVRFDSRAYFYANNAKNSWICYDFKEHKIVLENYTIRSYGTNGNAHPKSWAVEGSNDNNNWEIIDNQENSPYLKENDAKHTFAVQKEKLKEFKLVRIRQTGPTHRNDDVFLIDSVEFYGEFI